jgi:hypothetical protein
MSELRERILRELILVGAIVETERDVYAAVLEGGGSAIEKLVDAGLAMHLVLEAVSLAVGRPVVRAGTLKRGREQALPAVDWLPPTAVVFDETDGMPRVAFANPAELEAAQRAYGTKHQAFLADPKTIAWLRPSHEAAGWGRAEKTQLSPLGPPPTDAKPPATISGTGVRSEVRAHPAYGTDEAAPAPVLDEAEFDDPTEFSMGAATVPDAAQLKSED